MLVSFAVAAASAPSPYVRPVLTEELDELVFEELRHPCLEVAEGVSYIPNDMIFKRGTVCVRIRSIVVVRPLDLFPELSNDYLLL